MNPIPSLSAECLATLERLNASEAALFAKRDDGLSQIIAALRVICEIETDTDKDHSK